MEATYVMYAFGFMTMANNPNDKIPLILLHCVKPIQIPTALVSKVIQILLQCVKWRFKYVWKYLILVETPYLFCRLFKIK